MEISGLSIGGKKMKYKKFENTIIARIDKGEDIVEQVKNIALKENIKLASIQALGAINDFTVGVFKTKEKKYLKYPIIINQLQLSIVHSVMIDSGLNMNMKEAFAQDKDGGVLDYCRLNDITIQPWSSIQASWAEGTFIDHPNYQKLNDVMQQLAHKYQVTKPAIAIAWLLRHPAHMQPIVGTTSSQHLKETIKACDFTLTRQEWYDLYLASEKPLP